MRKSESRRTTIGGSTASTSTVFSITYLYQPDLSDDEAVKKIEVQDQGGKSIHTRIPSRRNCWASPVVLVKKKDVFVWTIYCSLNVVTKADTYPLPRIDDLLC